MPVTGAGTCFCGTVQRLWRPRTISLRSWGWARQFGEAGERPWPPSAALLEPLLAHLPLGEAIDLDAISERSGLSTARLLPRLLELELQGLVRRAGAGRFVRFDRPC